jgi:hypothetical protein
MSFAQQGLACNRSLPCVEDDTPCCFLSLYRFPASIPRPEILGALAFAVCGAAGVEGLRPGTVFHRSVGVREGRQRGPPATRRSTGWKQYDSAESPEAFTVSKRYAPPPVHSGETSAA